MIDYALKKAVSFETAFFLLEWEWCGKLEETADNEGV